MDSTQLLAATDSFFRALAANSPPHHLLTFFSTTSPVAIQHAPKSCPHPQTSRLHGLNAIRSYFDLVATHWERTAIAQHSTTPSPSTRSVTTTASVTWRWKKSGRTWNEDFTCTLEFDDHLKICSFIVTTESSAATCVMRAVDAEAAAQQSSNNASNTANSSFIEVLSVRRTPL